MPNDAFLEYVSIMNWDRSCRFVPAVKHKSSGATASKCCQDCVFANENGWKLEFLEQKFGYLGAIFFVVNRVFCENKRRVLWLKRQILNE